MLYILINISVSGALGRSTSVTKVAPKSELKRDFSASFRPFICDNLMKYSIWRRRIWLFALDWDRELCFMMKSDWASPLFACSNYREIERVIADGHSGAACPRGPCLCEVGEASGHMVRPSKLFQCLAKINCGLHPESSSRSIFPHKETTAMYEPSQNIIT